jgi:hypothetical protein
MDVEVESVKFVPFRPGRNPAMLTGKAYDTVTLQVPYGAPSSTMFTEAPEIPPEARTLLARERAVAVFPWTAAIRTASREAPVRMFRVIHARPNSVIPISRRRNIGSTSANSTRL